MSSRCPSLARALQIVSRLGTLVLLGGSVTLNLVQADRLRAEASPTAQPAAGTAMPALRVRSLDGQLVDITFRDRPVILYYFSPTCAWCERNWVNVKAIVAATEGKYRFIGLTSATSLGPFLRQRGLTFEVYTGLSPDAMRVYHFGGTPHTVLVSADGHVLHAWAGVYAGSQRADVERVFDVTLPGLSARSQGH
jgi:peroxiredoxin